MSADKQGTLKFKRVGAVFTWPYERDWEIDEDGMVAQVTEELELGTMPVFTELAAEINNAIRAKQVAEGLPVTPKWRMNTVEDVKP